MASSQKEEQQECLYKPNNNKSELPLVLIHCSQEYTDPSYNLWFRTNFRLLEPSDPSYPTLSPYVRVLLCVGVSPVSSETLEQLPSVECVVGTSVGINHIDLAEYCRRGNKVTNAGKAFSEDATDYAVGLLIDVLHRLSLADRFFRAGLWPVKGDYAVASKVNLVFLFSC